MYEEKLTYREAIKRKKASSLLGSPNIRILLGGNANLDLMIPGLFCGLANFGYKARCTSLPFDGWINSAITKEISADFWIVWLSSLASSRGMTERKDVDFTGVRHAATKLAQSGQNLILILPEPLPVESDPFGSYAIWRRTLAQQVRENLQESTIVVSLDHLQTEMGMENWHASRYWTMAKSPAHPDAMTRTGQFLASIVSQSLRPKIKAIVSDLDNTLWGGVVGDDGVENLCLDPDGSGSGFIQMQRFLKDQIERGIPVSICSKNTKDIAKIPFSERSEMLLALDDIVYFEASWKAKYLAIQNIADRLNIGLDAVCFIDDSPHERAEARNFLPELFVPEIPEDPEDRVQWLTSTGYFMTPRLQPDDYKRVQTYHENAKRQLASKKSVSIEAYLDGLDICMVPRPIDPSNQPRAAQLIQKTNQFNTSYKRLSASDINSMSDEFDSYTYVFSVSDKFGDSGIISALLATVVQNRVIVEEWVMSCRVFSRTIEHAILSHLMTWAKHKKLQRIDIPVEPNKKNALVCEFLESCGFTATGKKNKKLVFSISNLAPPKHHVKTQAFDYQI